MSFPKEQVQKSCGSWKTSLQSIKRTCSLKRTLTIEIQWRKRCYTRDDSRCSRLEDFPIRAGIESSFCLVQMCIKIVSLSVHFHTQRWNSGQVNKLFTIQIIFATCELSCKLLGNACTVVNRLIKDILALNTKTFLYNFAVEDAKLVKFVRK